MAVEWGSTPHSPCERYLQASSATRSEINGLDWACRNKSNSCTSQRTYRVPERSFPCLTGYSVPVAWYSTLVLQHFGVIGCLIALFLPRRHGKHWGVYSTLQSHNRRRSKVGGSACLRGRSLSVERFLRPAQTTAILTVKRRCCLSRVNLRRQTLEADVSPDLIETRELG